MKNYTSKKFGINQKSRRQLRSYKKKKERSTTAGARITIAGQEELFILGEVRLHLGLLPTSPGEDDEHKSLY